MVIDRYKNKEEGIYLDRSLTDIIKMISCLMVAIHHYAGYAISRGYSDSLILKAFSTQGGYLGVALFFFLSGYGLMKSEQKKHLGFKDFARKRFGKVFIPVLLVTAIWLPIYWFLIGGQYVDNQSFIRILWWMGDDVMWFVKTLALQYLFFYFYTVIRLYNHRYRLIVLLFICILAFCISYCNVVGHAISLPLFYLGVIIADFAESSRRLFKNVLVFVTLLLAILSTCFMGRHNMMTFHVSFNYLVVLSILFILSLRRISIAMIPSWIGGVSFDVYLVHKKCLMTMKYFMGYVPFWLFALVTIVTTGTFYCIRKTLKI